MKTKNAFALRGFDEQKFFQRQLKDCGLSETALIKPDGNPDDFDDLLRTRCAYLQFCDNLSTYRQRLARHIDRLGRYQATLVRAVASAPDDVYQNTIRPKSKRAVSLFDRYAGIAKKIRGAEQAAVVMRDRIDVMQRNCCLKIFARRLRETRQSLGLTQEAFGKVFGLGQRGYSNYEQGLREPPLSMLLILSQLSGRPVDWFVVE